MGYIAKALENTIQFILYSYINQAITSAAFCSLLPILFATRPNAN